jgi:hypothetical protein
LTAKLITIGLAAISLLTACGGAAAPNPAKGYGVTVVTTRACEDGADGWTITGHIALKSDEPNQYEGPGTYSGKMLQQEFGTPGRMVKPISGGALITGSVVGAKLNILGILNEFPLQTFGGSVAAEGGNGIDHDHVGRTSPTERGIAGPGCEVTWKLTVTKTA